MGPALLTKLGLVLISHAVTIILAYAGTLASEQQVARRCVPRVLASRRPGSALAREYIKHGWHVTATERIASTSNASQALWIR